MAPNTLLVSAAAIGLTLAYASVLDLRSRRVPFRTWYPMLAIGAPFTLWFYGALFNTDPAGALVLLALSGVFAGLFLSFGRLGLIGGADAWALAFVTMLLPAFPFTPLLGETPPGFFPLPLLVNTGLVALFVPVWLLARNWHRGVRGPLPARLRGYPVTADEITGGREFGFLMEELNDDDGTLHRRFFTLGELITAMLRDTRVYTRELRVDPERFRAEIALVQRASPVWIAAGIPFIVPLTIGFVVTLALGDTLFFILSRLLGV